MEIEKFKLKSQEYTFIMAPLNMKESFRKLFFHCAEGKFSIEKNIFMIGNTTGEIAFMKAFWDTVCYIKSKSKN